MQIAGKRFPHLYVTCHAKGIENNLAAELQRLGCKNLKLGSRGVFVYQATLKDVYKINYTSKIAERVLLPITTAVCHDKTELYNNIRSFDWTNLLWSSGKNAQTPEELSTFSIDVSGSHDAFNNTQFAARVCKDAICDQIRSQTAAGIRPNIHHKPDISLRLFLGYQSKTVNMYLDTSRRPLAHRDYIEDRPGDEAPIRSTVAAAILQSSSYDATTVFYDPFLGTGTFLFEALMHQNRIPAGYFRANQNPRSSDGWGFNKLPFHDEQEWEDVKKEEDSKIVFRKPEKPKFYGTDIRRECIDMVLQVLQTSMKPWIESVYVRKIDYSKFIPKSKPNLVVTNPPHGNRMGNMEALKKLYQDMPTNLKRILYSRSRVVLYTVPELAAQIPNIKRSEKVNIVNESNNQPEVFQFITTPETQPTQRTVETAQNTPTAPPMLMM